MPLIELKKLCKNYLVGDMDLPILKSVSLTIETGEFVAIMGPSGSGKSTLMNILGCLDKPSKGKYLLDGINIGKLNSDELAEIRNQKLGFVFQGFNLLSRSSALENVELPMVYGKISAQERTERATKALQAVGLGSRMHHQPNQLSGGQQQRVAIARAVVNNAPIIFADEPTGNLDTKMSVEIMELFTKLNKEFGRTIILVTHNTLNLHLCDKVVFFGYGGKLCFDGTPEDDHLETCWEARGKERWELLKK